MYISSALVEDLEIRICSEPEPDFLWLWGFSRRPFNRDFSIKHADGLHSYHAMQLSLPCLLPGYSLTMFSLRSACVPVAQCKVA